MYEGMKKMAKNVRVYFTSENDVESAHTSLQSLKISDLYIEEMPEGTEADTDMFIPLFATNIGTSGSASNLGMSGTAAPFVPGITEEDVGEEGSGSITHLLHFEVEEEDYDEAIAILKEFECYGTNEQS